MPTDPTGILALKYPEVQPHFDYVKHSPRISFCWLGLFLQVDCTTRALRVQWLSCARFMIQSEAVVRAFYTSHARTSSRTPTDTHAQLPPKQLPAESEGCAPFQIRPVTGPDRMIERDRSRWEGRWAGRARLLCSVCQPTWRSVCVCPPQLPHPTNNCSNKFDPKCGAANRWLQNAILQRLREREHRLEV